MFATEDKDAAMIAAVKSWFYDINQPSKLLLMGSVILNILFIAFLFDDIKHFVLGPHRVQSLIQLTSYFPERRGVIENGIQSALKDTQGTREQMREWRDAVDEILQEEAFDESSYLHYMENIHQSQIDVQNRSAEFIARLAKQSTKEERRILAELLRSPLPPLQ